MFDILKTALQQRGCALEPTSVLADFERALIQSVELQFPTSTTKGCFYHFAQAIWLKVSNHLEGWHNRLNKIVGKPHPNLFELTRTFQQEGPALI